MQFSVTFRNFEPTDSLKNYVAEKLDHVRKVVIKPIEAHVILTVEKFRHRAEVTMVTGGETLFGEEQTEDMYKSIDKVMDKVARQARRSRDRQKEHHRGGAHPLALGAVYTPDVQPEGEGDSFDYRPRWKPDVL